MYVNNKVPRKIFPNSQEDIKYTTSYSDNIHGQVKLFWLIDQSI